MKKDTSNKETLAMDFIYDRIGFSLPEGSKVKDQVTADLAEFKDSTGGTPALEVILDATHGGYVNRNFAFYDSEGQKKSYKSFFTPFPKPVLTEHDDGKAPIGRISNAEYLLLNEDSKKNNPTSKIRLTALVMDSEAIQKVLDGRYMTVSISGRPKTPPKCSICDEAVTSFFGCKNDHMRGRDYEGKICHYIFDEIEYSEVSFVNKPADQSKNHAASVVSVKVVTAPTMNADAQKMYSEAVKTLKGETAVADKEEVTDVVDEDKCAECEDLVYTDAEMAEIKVLADAGEDADATLTTKKRNALKGSTFCGPARSYPVPDCSHGANAKARATQQVKAGKLSASAAAKIKACANRKMKSLGCGGSDSLTTGNAVVDALIELVNELRSSYESDLETLRNENKAAATAAATKQADTEKELNEVKVTRDTLATEVAGAKETHTHDLEQATSLSDSLKDATAKNAILMSLVLKKDSFLNVFSGQNAEERAESFNKKLKEYGSISLQDLTIKSEELFSELTKQAIIQPATDELDPVLAGKIRNQQSKTQRLRTWIRGR